MFEFLYDEVIKLHGSVGLFHGFLFSFLFALKFLFSKNLKHIKTFVVRVAQGTATGYLAAIANVSVFSWFTEPSVAVSVVFGSIGGLAGLVYAQAVLDKVAKQVGLNIPNAETNLFRSDDVATELAEFRRTDVPTGSQGAREARDRRRSAEEKANKTKSNEKL